MSKAMLAVVIVGGTASALGLVAAGAYSGSTLFILLGVVGVPLFVVGLAVVHYLNLVQRAGDLGHVRERHFQATCKRWNQTLQQANDLARRAGVSEATRQELQEKARSLLEPHAVVHMDDDSVEVTPGDEDARGGWVHRTDNALEELLRDIGRKAHPELDERLDTLEDELDMGEAVQFEPLPEGSLEHVCRAYLDQLERAEDAVEILMDNIEEAISNVEAAGIDVSEAWNHHRSARRLWTEGQAELAIKALEDARAIVNTHLRPEFEERQEGLLSTIQQLRDLGLQGVAPPNVLDTLKRLETDVQDLELDGGGIVSLEQSERRFAGLVRDVGKAAVREVKKAREAIDAYPDLRGDDAIDEIVETLETAPEVAHPYQESFPAWFERARQAIPRIKRYTQDAALVRHLPRIEEIIAEHLAEKGEVRPGDLPVREKADDILSIYARLHPDDVVFDQGVLSSRKGMPSG